MILAIRRCLHTLYHEIRTGGSPYSYVTDAVMFDRHAELYSRLRDDPGGSLAPEITFDDGHISNLAVAAPILASHALRARFFITVGWTGQRPAYMGWAELRELQAAGHAIGAHGWSHALLTHCDAQQLQRELGTARLTLEDKLGASITTMSLPGGRSNRGVLAACFNSGYSHVFTSEPKAEMMPLHRTIGRFNIRGDMQPEWLAELLRPESNVLASVARKHRIKETLKSLLGDGLYAKLWSLGNRQEPEADDGWRSAD